MTFIEINWERGRLARNERGARKKGELSTGICKTQLPHNHLYYLTLSNSNRNVLESAQLKSIEPGEV
jgi:hypothetical protein